MLEALLLALGGPAEVCPAGNLADVVVTDSSGQQISLGAGESGRDAAGLGVSLGPLSPGSGEGYRLSLLNTSELVTYELVVTLEGVEVPQVLVSGAHPLVVQAGLSTGQVGRFPGPGEGATVTQPLGSLGPGQQADLVLDFALAPSPALSPDGMTEQAVFEVGLGATVDCGQAAGGQHEEQLGGELPGESQDGERLVGESWAGSVLEGGPGRQFLARTGASGLVAVGLGASLVLAGGAWLVVARRRSR